MELFWFFVIVIDAILSGLVAWVAKERGRSVGGFFAFSFFFSFVIALVVLVALPNLKPVNLTQPVDLTGLSKCPHCAELIKSEAAVCKFCQRDVSEAFAAQRAEELVNEQRASDRATLLRIEEEAAQKEKVLLEETERLERVAKSRARLRSPKFWLAVFVALAIVAGLAVTALSLQSQQLEAQRLAQQSRIDAAAEEYLRLADFQTLVGDCETKFPSKDLLATHVSSDGQALTVKYLLSTREESGLKGFNYFYAEDLGEFFLCVYSIIPESIFGPDRVFFPGVNMGASPKTSYKNYSEFSARGLSFFETSLRVFGSTKASNSGPFEVTIRKSELFDDNVAKYFAGVTE